MAGCGDDGSGPIAISAIGGPPRLLNPNREPVDTPSALLLDAAAQGLVRFDAGGEIEPALAQRWIVSDDGLRYTFRLRAAKWTDGSRVTAEQVVARLKTATDARSANRLKPILGAIDETVAMTDDVLEISLRSPRPNFLQLLAQPEMALLKGGRGAGPYRAEPDAMGALSLSLPKPDEEEEAEASPLSPPLLLRGEPAPAAVARFAEGDAELVLGGSLGDLPFARAGRPARGALRFDPAAGVLGLQFVAAGGPLGQAQLRQAIAMSIDRGALVAAFGVPGWTPRESLLPPGIEGMNAVSAPAWILQPLDARRAAAAAVIRRVGAEKPIALRVAMPEGPGWRLVFAHLRRDWASVGISATAVASDADADLRLVDEVAPAALASWYLRRFTCATSPICDPVADERLAAARLAPDALTRRAMLADADRILAGLGPFITLAAPVRWSLVAPRLTGFRLNAFARHPVSELIRPVP